MEAKNLLVLLLLFESFGLEQEQGVAAALGAALIPGPLGLLLPLVLTSSRTAIAPSVSLEVVPQATAIRKYPTVDINSQHELSSGSRHALPAGSPAQTAEVNAIALFEGQEKSRPKKTGRSLWKTLDGML